MASFYFMGFYYVYFMNLLDGCNKNHVLALDGRVVLTRIALASSLGRLVLVKRRQVDVERLGNYFNSPLGKEVVSELMLRNVLTVKKHLSCL
jgi:hypothetical protein